MEHCAQLSSENQVISVIFCTINRRTQKHWKTAYHTVKLCVCSKTSEVIKHLKDLKDSFIKRGYESKILDHHFERTMSVDREILLENKEKPST